VHKTSQEEALDERRLVLRVSPADGTILGPAGSTSTTLFGVDPSSLAGRSVAEVVDVLGEWAKAGEWLRRGRALLQASRTCQCSSCEYDPRAPVVTPLMTAALLLGAPAAGNQVATALNALAARSAGKAGSSWRVAVTPLASAHATQGAGLGATFARLNARAAAEKGRARHAIMQVRLAEGAVQCRCPPEDPLPCLTCVMAPRRPYPPAQPTQRQAPRQPLSSLLPPDPAGGD
jgi:hypothetical protein